MRLGLIIILLLTSLFSVSQKHSFFFDAGASITQPIQREFGQPIDPTVPGFGEHDVFHDGLGAYFKAGANFRLCVRDKWNFSVPCGFSLLMLNEKSEYDFYYFQANQNYHTKIKNNLTNYMCGLNFGPQINFTASKYSFYTNILMNPLCSVKSKSETIDEISGHSGSYQNGFNKTISWMLSYGLGFQYNLKKGSIGINTDVYVMDPFNQFSRVAVQTKWARLWICPGIRYEIRLF